ncbi:MAG: PIN domain-containing protein [Bradymonadaceae bacterium]
MNTRRLLDDMLDGDLDYYLSVDLLTEYRQVLVRPNIRSLHQLSDDELDAVLEALSFHAIFRDPPDADSDAPDAGDQHLWNLAAALPDATLVTGDHELVDNAPPDLSVLSPNDYLDLM